MAISPGQDTQHGFLVVWGQFAQAIGLIAQLEAVDLAQKTREHSPQAKVLEFLVAILSGAKYLQDLSRSAHPLDRDPVVAQAWGQAAWADYSGVSRTLSGLSWEEVHSVVRVLEQVSQPFLDQELNRIRSTGQPLKLDGDLTGLPVSNTSRTYPQAAYGYMDDEIRLGYQAGVTSLSSPTYGRLWLSVQHHPGDVVSMTQAEALVRAAEQRTGLRPCRRTDMLQTRMDAFQKTCQPAVERLASQTRLLEKAQVAVQLTQVQQEQAQQNAQPDPEEVQRLEKHCVRCQQALIRAQTRLEKTQRWLARHTQQAQILQERLECFRQENRANANPVEMCFRLDAGFGTYENIALLIEMGYEVYTKLHNHKIVQALRRQAPPEAVWTRVGENAEMLAWPDHPLQTCPYPLTVGLERFYIGEHKVQHSGLAYFGKTAVQSDLPAWFATYNGRQTIEAGIKETKQVFYLHRLKVRSAPAIYLQEVLTVFAANFIRWASVWIQEHAQPHPNALLIEKMSIKRQVEVAAHASARVIRDSNGLLVRFSPASSLAGKSLYLRVLKPPIHPKFLLRFLRFWL